MNEIEILCTQILGCSRATMYINRELNFTLQQKEFFISALKRRVLGEPLQYILGNTEFMGLEFKVNPAVFIPRPETEVLVEHAIEIALTIKKEKQNLRILDLGTGSGCIAISLAKYLLDRNVIIDATDVSKEALDVAKLNSLLNQVKINFIQTDLFKGIKKGSYDLIVSNPPYLASNQISRFGKELSYEPSIALDGGRDGFKFLRKIIKDAHFYLRPSGYLMLEIGYGQVTFLKNFFKNIKNLRIIDIIKDYSNIDRVIIAKKYG